jgi:murein DD-endopeptidase MepM/ murein hydrolase activator NlpD
MNPAFPRPSLFLEVAMRSVIDRIGIKRARTSYVRRARTSESIYVDSAPAGDPTYDPFGTSRPFRPTHRTHAGRSAPQRSYRDIERKISTSQTPAERVLEALKQNVQWRIEEHNPFEKLRVAGYGSAAIVAGVCVLVLGGSLLAQAFPMNQKNDEVQTDYAAATNVDTVPDSTDEPTPGESSSSRIAAPTAGDPDATAASPSSPVEAEPGMPMVDGIADSTMRLYVNAAETCDMPWQILAAVGRVETNHGTSNAAGVKSGANFAGAKGPMQFMQNTWNKYGLDANRDGKADIYNLVDSVYSAASYLCANGAGEPKSIDNALWHYNHSDTYVAYVKETAASYYESSYRAPLPVDSVSDAVLATPHHDYAAADLPVPAGTPVFAVRKGTVHVIKNDACGYGIQLNGTDGIRYTYCHASKINVVDGAKVNAGTVLLHSGGEPGAPGAGDSTGPHLHFEMAVNSVNVCPQPVLKNWMKGAFANPATAPAQGCAY